MAQTDDDRPKIFSIPGREHTNGNEASSEDQKIEVSLFSVREFPSIFPIGNGPPSDDKVYVYTVHNGNVLLPYKYIYYSPSGPTRGRR